MDVNSLIENAMGGAGKLIGGKELYILEGQVERNEFRIKNAEDCYKDNMTAFGYKLSTGFIFLGMYTSEEAAQETIGFIRTLLRDEEGKTLL